MIIINTHQKVLNCNIFYKIFLGEHAPKRAKPLIKGMASLSCGYMCSVFFDT